MQLIIIYMDINGQKRIRAFHADGIKAMSSREEISKKPVFVIKRQEQAFFCEKD